MSKHTPGPWKEEVDDVMQAASVRDASNRGVCPVAGMTFDERKANAALIAAAPDMLDALGGELHLSTARLLDWAADRMVNVYGESENVDFVQSIRKRAELCRAALQKAKGTP